MFLYLAGLVLIAAVALVVSRPFFLARPTAAVERERGLPQRQKDEALAAIRDADFDFQTGKLSDEDYKALRSGLEQRALAAMDTLEATEASRKKDPA